MSDSSKNLDGSAPPPPPRQRFPLGRGGQPFRPRINPVWAGSRKHWFRYWHIASPVISMIVNRIILEEKSELCRLFPRSQKMCNTHADHPLRAINCPWEVHCVSECERTLRYFFHRNCILVSTFLEFPGKICIFLR